MKKRFLALLCLSMLSLPLFAQMSKTEMQKMYMEYMRSQRISAEVDRDGDIAFQWEGSQFSEMTYYIIIYEDDQQFFQVLKVGGYSLDNAAEQRNAYLAAAAANRIVSGAKVYVNSAGDNMNFSAETLLASPRDFAEVFQKMMRSLESAMLTFVNEME